MVQKDGTCFRPVWMRKDVGNHGHQSATIGVAMRLHIKKPIPGGHCVVHDSVFCLTLSHQPTAAVFGGVSAASGLGGVLPVSSSIRSAKNFEQESVLTKLHELSTASPSKNSIPESRPKKTRPAVQIPCLLLRLVCRTSSAAQTRPAPNCWWRCPLSLTWIVCSQRGEALVLSRHQRKCSAGSQP
jgi:hypothetical protein